MQQLLQQNLAYEQKLYDNYINIEPSKRKVDYQQEISKIQQQSINQQQPIYEQPTQYQQNQIQNNALHNQQQYSYPIQNQNYQNNQLSQAPGQESLLGQPTMKDQNKTYL
ncbi:hypothetical protein ABPG72_021531 [Tetrahymena utriculariae]